MSGTSLRSAILRLVRGLPPADGTGDAALLERFIAWRDEAAFELLVYRHGPMVRGLCRRVLRHEQDAEDAFQATFLALARQAPAVRGGSLAGWLYRVAFHAALKAKARSARRGTAALPAEISRDTDPVDELLAREVRAVLDEEVMRLPARYRLPVVLCYLQGRSNSEAAAELGCPKGTVDSRLAEARRRLRGRLLRRGLAPAAAADLERVLGSASDAAELPGAVVRPVARAALAFMSNHPAAGAVPVSAAVLTNEVLQAMYLSKLKWSAAAVLVLGLFGSGAGVATYEALAGGQTPVQESAKADPPDKPPADAPLPAKVDGPGNAVQGRETLPERPERRAAEIRGPKSARQVCQLLQQPVPIDKPIENAPLKDVLEFLSDNYAVTFIVDTQAFDQDQGNKTVEDSMVRLPKMPGVTMSTVLRFLLAQVGGTYLIHRDYIEITTHRRQIVDAFGPGAGGPAELLPPTVNIAFDNQPLEKALADLADQTGRNFVLDPRVQEKDKLMVSVQLLNTPVGAAVRVIADMVGLQPVTIGNVFYVTTKENADRLYKQENLEPDPGSPSPPAQAAQPAKPDGT
jgi:RNA polymerase sigma factor (sigma-70 family)